MCSYAFLINRFLQLTLNLKSEINVVKQWFKENQKYCWWASAHVCFAPNIAGPARVHSRHQWQCLFFHHFVFPGSNYHSRQRNKEMTREQKQQEQQMMMNCFACAATKREQSLHLHPKIPHQHQSHHYYYLLYLNSPRQLQLYWLAEKGGSRMLSWNHYHGAIWRW